MSPLVFPGASQHSGEGKAAGITSCGDSQCLLRSGPLGLLRGAPTAPWPAARCHGGRCDRDGIHQPWDTLDQQQGDTTAPFTSQGPPKDDRRRDPTGHPRTLAVEDTQSSSSPKSWGPAAECNTRGHQLTLSFPEGWCPPSAPLPKSPETCVCPGRRSELAVGGSGLPLSLPWLGHQLSPPQHHPPLPHTGARPPVGPLAASNQQSPPARKPH